MAHNKMGRARLRAKAHTTPSHINFVFRFVELYLVVESAFTLEENST